MRLLFAILLLAVLLCKSAEPALTSYQFMSALWQEQPDLAAEQTDFIEMKMYAPMPYGTNHTDEEVIGETYQSEDSFYRIVERRYHNDTLYLRLQPNENAHTRFDDLSSSINQLLDLKTASNADTKAPYTLSDFLKVFPPPAPPVIVSHEGGAASFGQKTTFTFTQPISSVYTLLPALPPENC